MLLGKWQKLKKNVSPLSTPLPWTVSLLSSSFSHTCIHIFKHSVCAFHVKL